MEMELKQNHNVGRSLKGLPRMQQALCTKCVCGAARVCVCVFIVYVAECARCQKRSWLAGVHLQNVWAFMHTFINGLRGCIGVCVCVCVQTPDQWLCRQTINNNQMLTRKPWLRRLPVSLGRLLSSCVTSPAQKCFACFQYRFLFFSVSCFLSSCYCDVLFFFLF